LTALLVILTVIDLGIAVLFIAVSGFVLEGVNGTGTGADAGLYVGFILVCLMAPAVAWWLRSRAANAAYVVALAAGPPTGLAAALLLQPLFV
jgi:hypothetical protein